MSLFGDNIAALADRFPEFARDIAACEPVVLARSESRSGAPNAKCGELMLHSAYDPEQEARRLLATLASAKRDTAIEAAKGWDSAAVFGFGLGHVVRACHAAARNGEHGLENVVVLVPDLRLFRAELAVADVRDLLASGRVSFVTGSQAMFRALDGMRSRSALFVPSPAYRQLFPEAFEDARAIVGRFNARETINSRTLERFGMRWTRNLARNARAIARHPGVAKAASLFDGIPALVAAAGPSLDILAPRLGDIARRALIVCVDTALHAVLKAGVEPDFVVVVDPQFWNARHLDRCPFPKGVMVTEAAVWPTVLRSDCAKVLLCESLYPLGRFLERRGEPKGELGAGGSVATSAWDFARIAGCDPVYMAGLDLGFPGKATHAAGSYFERRALQAGTRFEPAETHSLRAFIDAYPKRVRANDGGEAWSDSRMSLYAWWFESKLAKHRGCDTRNCSAKGTAIPGMPYAPIDELLALPERRGEIDRAMDEVRALPDAGDDSAAIAELSALLDSLAESARSGAETAQRAKGKGGKALVSALAALEKVDAKLSENEARDIVGFVATDIARFAANGLPSDAAEGSSSSRDSRDDETDAVLERSRALYEAILQAAERVLDVLSPS